MKTDLYRRKFVRLKRERMYAPRMGLSSALDEARWFTRQGYNLSNTYYKYVGSDSRVHTYQRYLNDTDNVLASQPHGDFRSDYAYHKQSYLVDGYCFVVARTLYWNSSPRTEFTGSGWPNVPSMGSSTTLNDVRNSAKLALGKKILDGMPSWDISTDVAELKSTISTFTQSVTRLKDLILGCLLRDWRMIVKALGMPANRKSKRKARAILWKYRDIDDRALAATKAAGDFWLLYRYGIMPILYSAQDAIDVMHKSSMSSAVHTFQVTFKQKEPEIKRSGWESSPYGRYSIKKENRSTHEWSLRLRAKVTYADNIRNRMAIDPFTAPRVVYELVPLSFVLDWLWDVGGWLNHLRLDTVVGKMTVVETIKSRGYGMVEMGLPIPGYGCSATVEFSPGRKAEGHLHEFKRTITSLAGVTPKVLGGLNFKHMLDTAGLMLQFCKHPTHKGIPK